jgi:hypothetical protein
MATVSDGAFRFLSLCAQRPGSAAVAQRLPSALSAVPSFDEFAIAAEHHGMEPLVHAHIERTGLTIPAWSEQRQTLNTTFRGQPRGHATLRERGVFSACRSEPLADGFS